MYVCMYGYLLADIAIHKPYWVYIYTNIHKGYIVSHTLTKFMHEESRNSHPTELWRNDLLYFIWK